jgi:predicted transcriptional regulator
VLQQTKKTVILAKKGCMTDTSELKNALHEIIDRIEDQATLEAMRTLLTPQVGVRLYRHKQSLETDEIDNLLEESEADIKAGRTVSHQEMKAQIQSWRKQSNAK